MEKIEFTNKIWISNRSPVLEISLNIFIIIYILAQLILIWMDGLDFLSIMQFIIIFAGLCMIRSKLQNRGFYGYTPCSLTFNNGSLLWEYPCMNVKNKTISLSYSMFTNDIEDIALSRELSSIRLICRPKLVENDGRESKMIDYSQSKQPCVLVLYYDDIDRMYQLFAQYLTQNITIVNG